MRSRVTWNGQATAATIGALIGGLVTGGILMLTVMARLGSIERTVETLPYPYNAERSILRRAKVDAHVENEEVHLTKGDLKQVLMDVLEDRGL